MYQLQLVQLHLLIVQLLSHYLLLECRYYYSHKVLISTSLFWILFDHQHYISLLIYHLPLPSFLIIFWCCFVGSILRISHFLILHFTLENLTIVCYIQKLIDTHLSFSGRMEVCSVSSTSLPLLSSFSLILFVTSSIAGICKFFFNEVILFAILVPIRCLVTYSPWKISRLQPDLLFYPKNIDLFFHIFGSSSTAVFPYLLLNIFLHILLLFNQCNTYFIVPYVSISYSLCRNYKICCFTLKTLNYFFHIFGSSSTAVFAYLLLNIFYTFSFFSISVIPTLLYLMCLFHKSM